MSGKRSSRQWCYDDILRIPMPMEPSVADALASASIEGSDPEAIETWRQLVQDAQERDRKNLMSGLRGFLDRIQALGEHFQIEGDWSKPGWDRDLALSLAMRHEPDHFTGGAITLSQVFRKYDIDPDSPSADWLLVFKLAEKHVFREPPKPKESRFSLQDFDNLAIAIAVVSAKLGASRDQPKAAAVARILTTPAELRKWIPPKAADHVARTIATKGNDGHNRASPAGSISQSTIEKRYIPQLWTAQRAYMKGNATAFQRQFVEDVLPFLSRYSED